MKGRRGVSLIEIIVATAILAVVLVASVGLLPSAHMLHSRARNILVGQSVLRAELERVRGLEFDLIPAAYATIVTRENYNFKVDIVCTPVGASPPMLLDVRASVTWGASPLERLEAHTRIARLGQ